MEPARHERVNWAFIFFNLQLGPTCHPDLLHPLLDIALLPAAIRVAAPSRRRSAPCRRPVPVLDVAPPPAAIRAAAPSPAALHPGAAPPPAVVPICSASLPCRFHPLLLQLDDDVAALRLVIGKPPPAPSTTTTRRTRRAPPPRTAAGASASWRRTQRPPPAGAVASSTSRGGSRSNLRHHLARPPPPRLLVASLAAAPRPPCPSTRNQLLEEFLKMHQEIEDKSTHEQLRNDLGEHLWAIHSSR
ncbi:proline-rich protein 36-like [Panicum virgatum]|uniref:proline-rich protein 36-like n=1 Tax=Panicum virgatum TaxID=38727 RepID=UPI0019D56BD8|nr:proline-rich protein 36-like [Panicum virgatum]